MYAGVPDDTTAIASELPKLVTPTISLGAAFMAALTICCALLRNGTEDMTLSCGLLLRVSFMTFVRPWLEYDPPLLAMVKASRLLAVTWDPEAAELCVLVDIATVGA